jgi:hypothetical protein
MQFSAIYGEVANYFDSSGVTRAKLWANQAAHEIYAQRRWSFLESRSTVASVSGQADYVLAGATPVIPDYDGIISIRHNVAAGSPSSPKLLEMLQDHFDDTFGASGATPGIPAVYTIRGNTPAANAAAVHTGGEVVASFFPVMNYVGAIIFNYWRSGAGVEMVADTDLPLLPAQYHRAIIDLAIGRGLQMESQPQEAAPILARADQVIAQAMKADELNRPTPRANRLIVSPNLPPDPSTGGARVEPGYRWDTRG